MGTLSSNPHFKDLGQAGFLIRHYAGDVTYEATGMTDKNKDQLVFDLLEALQMSKNQFLLSLFPEKVWLLFLSIFSGILRLATSFHRLIEMRKKDQRLPAQKSRYAFSPISF